MKYIIYFCNSCAQILGVLKDKGMFNFAREILFISKRVKTTMRRLTKVKKDKGVFIMSKMSKETYKYEKDLICER